MQGYRFDMHFVVAVVVVAFLTDLQRIKYLQKKKKREYSSVTN